MTRTQSLLPLLCAGTLASGAAAPASACATCGCTLSTDAATGYSTMAGWRFNLEADYINQDQLRTGLRTASPAQVVNAPSNPSLGGGEIERQTINRYLSAAVHYSPSPDWNLTAVVPYVQRDHTTYGQQLTPYSAAATGSDQISGARVSGLGDVKLIGSYQGFLPGLNLGVQLGVKLPTGAYGTRVSFDSGPNVGTPLDASLQAGTGSTDVIVGAYYYQPVGTSFDAFVNGQLQVAVAERQNQPGNDFRPGNSATLSLGLRYGKSAAWTPQLQLNLSRKLADQGALADSPDTAGTVAYLSPGVTVRLPGRVRVYGFVQMPVYSRLEGYQLFPHWTTTLGVSYAP